MTFLLLIDFSYRLQMRKDLHILKILLVRNSVSAKITYSLLYAMSR